MGKTAQRNIEEKALVGGGEAPSELDAAEPLDDLDDVIVDSTSAA